MSKKYIFKLKDVANITMGQSPKSEYYNQEGEGTPFLQGNSTFGDKYPKIEKYTTKETRISNKNEVLMSVRAPVGDININPFEKICVGRGLCSIQLHNNQNEYLYYFLKANQRKIQNKGTGTVFSATNKSDVENIEIYIPDEIQIENITKKLKVLDDKIENNNAIIANLEEQAQTIFKSWFVDLEPFQDSDFIKSELGELPEKWGIAKLSNLFEIKYGKNLPTKKLEEEGFPVFGGNGQIGYYHEYLFEEPKLLISCRGAASGKVLVSLPNSFITNNSLVMNEFNRDYFHYFKYLFNTIEFENYATGSAQPQITISNIKDIEVVVPTEDIIKKFNKLLNPFFTLQLNLKKENIRLEEARDTLLPKLMSGEIRVEETIEVEEM